VTTINPREIQQFNSQAHLWWNESGPFKPLHRINPIRLSFIKQEICTHFKLDPTLNQPLSGLSIIDVGCGGGLVSEPLTRLGASLTGLDGGADNIEVARQHAKVESLSINYVADTLENHVQNCVPYDVCVALEVIEHVEDVGEFVKACAQSVKPGGLVIFSTLNRTVKSLALGVGMAEYVLRWVPRGTHTWSHFLKPSEITMIAQGFELSPVKLKGLSFNPFSGSWRINDDCSINYFLTFTKL